MNSLNIFSRYFLQIVKIYDSLFYLKFFHRFKFPFIYQESIFIKHLYFQASIQCQIIKAHIKPNSGNTDMQENYFTGDLGSNPINPKQSETNEQIQQNLQAATLQSLEQMNISEQQNKDANNDNNQENKQIKQDFVDVQQVTIQSQQIEEQKFIENNASLAAQNKKSGNQKYGQKRYTQALVQYRKCLQYTDKVSEQDINFRAIIYSNIGLTYMKMNQQEFAIEYFQNSLKLKQSYTKARANLALCFEATAKPQQALQEYKKVLLVTPHDKYIKEKTIFLQIKVKELQQKRKQQVIGGLKNIGNSILGYFGMSLDNFKLQKGPGGGYNVAFKQ